MTEFNLIIDNKEFSYRGIFSVDDLLRKINQLTDQHGYQRVEKKTEETVTSEGKELYLELRPFKTKTNYVMLWLKIKLHLTNMTDTVKELPRGKRVLQQGDVHLVLDAWTMTDYSSRWGQRPITFFLKAVVNKYLYKFPLEESFLREIAGDGTTIFNELQSYVANYVYEQGLREKEKITPITAVPLEKEARVRKRG